MSEAIIQTALALAIIAGYVASYLYGIHRGFFTGWQDGYFRRMKDDAGRRDHFGKFKAQHAPQHQWRAGK